MARFVRGRAVKTRKPVVTVGAGLPVGTHRFQLIVVDESGNQSRPARVDVIVERTDFRRSLPRKRFRS